ncbi:hypothetical protein YC2023_052987 [Brassica napus]
MGGSDCLYSEIGGDACGFLHSHSFSLPLIIVLLDRNLDWKTMNESLEHQSLNSCGGGFSPDVVQTSNCMYCDLLDKTTSF